MAGGTFLKCKALPGFFLCIFSCLKKPVFSKRDLVRWKVPARLYWDPVDKNKRIVKKTRTRRIVKNKNKKNLWRTRTRRIVKNKNRKNLWRTRTRRICEEQQQQDL